MNKQSRFPVTRPVVVVASSSTGRTVGWTVGTGASTAAAGHAVLSATAVVAARCPVITVSGGRPIIAIAVATSRRTIRVVSTTTPHWRPVFVVASLRWPVVTVPDRPGIGSRSVARTPVIIMVIVVVMIIPSIVRLLSLIL